MVLIHLDILDQSSGIWFPQNLAHTNSILRVESVNGIIRNIPAEFVELLLET